MVALTLGAGARGLATKTGSDQGVVIDGELLAWWTAELAKNLAPGAALVPLTQIQFRRHWWEGLMAIGLQQMGPPHSLRHSRPSHDVMTGQMTLEAARRRGRWQSLKSVQRYTKSHALIQKQAALDATQLEQGQHFWDNMAESVKKLDLGDSVPAAALRVAADLASRPPALKQKSNLKPKAARRARSGDKEGNTGVR